VNDDQNQYRRTGDSSQTEDGAEYRRNADAAGLGFGTKAVNSLSRYLWGMSKK
jgi:hypothetical protein